MRNARLAALLVGATALTLACSSTTAPKPTYVGTWQVSVGTLTQGGTITPSSFTVTVTQVSGGVAVTMPSLAYSNGPETFGSFPDVTTGTDSTLFGFNEMAVSPTNACDKVDIAGHGNASRDTLLGAQLAILDTVTISGTVYCHAINTAPVTAVKQ